MNTEDFIKRSKEVHGDKYDYSKTIFNSYKEKVVIICPNHGEINQTPNNHLYGKKGCKHCSGNQIKTKENIIKEFNLIHGSLYDYSLVEYTGVFNKVEINCVKHGGFKQTPKNHLNGKGCPKCAGKGLSKKEILNNLKEIHGNIYDYSLSEPKKAKDKIKIICKKHGVFKQSLDSHKRGRGCPVCKNSKGEKGIINFMIKENIEFDYQKKFDGCVNPKTGKHLVFDFYLTDFNICIEYDGEQHFKPMRFSKKNNIQHLEEIKKRDEIKNLFCKKNNIKLVRIKYIELDNIDEFIRKELIKLKVINS